MTPTLFDDDDLIDCFNEGALERGKDYWRRRAVLRCVIQPDDESWRMEAVVRGSEPAPYALSAKIEHSRNRRLHVRNECSRPLGGDCKHVVAALFAAREQLSRRTPALQQALAGTHLPGNEGRAGQQEVVTLLASHGLPLKRGARAGFGQPPAKALPPALEQWLNALAQTSNTAPMNEGQCLLYELGHPLKDGALGLRLLLARRLKMGEYSAAKPYGNVRVAAYDPPAFVREEDKPVLRRLEHCLRRF